MPALASLTFLAICVAGALIVGDLKRNARARENALYRAVLEALPNALNVKDRDGRFIIANAAAAEQMRAGSVANLIERTDFDFYPRESAETFLGGDRKVFEDGNAFFKRQRLTFGDGSSCWVGTTKAPFAR